MHHRQGVWHSDRLKADRESAKAANVAREAALAFLEADANGDGILDWEEVRQSNHLRVQQVYDLNCHACSP